MKKFFSLIFTLILAISFSSTTSAATNHVHLENHEADNHVHLDNHEADNHVHLDNHELDNLEQQSVVITGNQKLAGSIGIEYVPCPVTGGKHQMKARGTGKHQLTTGGQFIGNLTQCSGCLITLTSEYNYFNSGTRSKGPGKYIQHQAPVFVSPAGYIFSGTQSLQGPATSWLTGIFGSMAFSY